MRFNSRTKWLRLKYLTQIAVILILGGGILAEALDGEVGWRHWLQWTVGSLVAYGVIEVISRNYLSLNQRLEEQLLQSEQRIRTQKALIDLSSSLATSRDEEQICQIAIQTLEQKFGYDRASILLGESGLNTQRISSQPVEGVGLSAPTQLVQAIQPPEPGSPPSIAHLPAPFLAPLLRVRAPLRNAATHFGVLVVESYRGKPFTPEELSVVYAVANLISISLQNARHYKEQHHRQVEAERKQRELAGRERSLALLNQVTREALQARGLNSLIVRVSEHISRLFSADTCLFALWDERQECSLIQHAYGYRAEWINNPLQDPAIRKIDSMPLTSSQALPIAKPSISPWIHPRLIERLGSQTLLALPLIARDQKLGVILLSYRKPHALSSTELGFAEQIANQVALAIAKEQALEVAQHRAKELDALQKATKALLSTLELEALLEQILDAALSAIPAAESGQLHLVVPETGELQLYAAQGGEERRIRLFKPASEESYSAQAVRQRKPFLIEDIHSERAASAAADFPDLPKISSLIVAPLLTAERVYGALALGSSRKSAFNANDLQLLVSFAATATTALRNAQLHAAVQQQAVTDPLTGLYNRRGFWNLAEHEFLRAHRFRRPLSLMMVDIDLLKQINDTYGHLVGDKILSIVSANCRAELRQVDIVARYGGDEFIVLLPETTLQEALQVAERLRSRIEGLHLSHNGDRLNTTICVGVAELCPGDTLDSLIERTDQALYLAKQSGRNQVRVSSQYPSQEKL
ncbi:MAG: diguanylate cyclase [Anaerolineales bacterium]|nr:diguanylate cyclase [Anaerolineales bacterium]MDW8446232.1 diguanylate cyclase [Anaerolineales bacterium]